MFFRGKWLQKGGRLEQPWILANGVDRIRSQIQDDNLECETSPRESRNGTEMETEMVHNLPLLQMCNDFKEVVDSKSNNLKHRISLRLSGKLIHGICMLYEKQLEHLYGDCYKVLYPKAELGEERMNLDTDLSQFENDNEVLVNLRSPQTPIHRSTMVNEESPLHNSASPVLQSPIEDLETSIYDYRNSGRQSSINNSRDENLQTHIHNSSMYRLDFDDIPEKYKDTVVSLHSNSSTIVLRNLHNSADPEERFLEIIQRNRPNKPKRNYYWRRPDFTKKKRKRRKANTLDKSKQKSISPRNNSASPEDYRTQSPESLEVYRSKSSTSRGDYRTDSSQSPEVVRAELPLSPDVARAGNDDFLPEENESYDSNLNRSNDSDSDAPMQYVTLRNNRLNYSNSPFPGALMLNILPEEKHDRFHSSRSPEVSRAELSPSPEVCRAERFISDDNHSFFGENVSNDFHENTVYSRDNSRISDAQFDDRNDFPPEENESHNSNFNLSNDSDLDASVQYVRLRNNRPNYSNSPFLGASMLSTIPEEKHETVKMYYEHEFPDMKKLVIITKNHDLIKDNLISQCDESDQTKKPFDPYDLLQRLCKLWREKDVIYMEEIIEYNLDNSNNTVLVSRAFQSLLILKQSMYIDVEKDETGELQSIKKGRKLIDILNGL